LEVAEEAVSIVPFHSLIAAYAPCTLTTEYFLHTGREDMWSH